MHARLPLVAVPRKSHTKDIGQETSSLNPFSEAGYCGHERVVLWPTVSRTAGKESGHLCMLVMETLAPSLSVEACWLESCVSCSGSQLASATQRPHEDGL